MLKLLALLSTATLLSAQYVPVPFTHVSAGPPYTAVNFAAAQQSSTQSAYDWVIVPSGATGNQSNIQAGGSLNHTAGNLLVVGVGFRAVSCATVGTVTVSTVADSSYTSAGTAFGISTLCVYVFYIPTTAGSSADTLTIHQTGSTTSRVAIVGQFSGMTSPTVDVYSGAGNSSTSSISVTSTAFTTTVAHEIAIAFSVASTSAHGWSTGTLDGASMTLPTSGQDTASTMAIAWIELTGIKTSKTATITQASATNTLIIQPVTFK